jgi:PKD repeat protein
VYRRTGGTGNGTVVHTRSLTAPWWDLPVMTYTDPNATGTNYQYRVQVSDPNGNVANTPWTAVATAPAASNYLTTVLASEPDSLWRLGESPGATVAADTVGWHDATIPATGVTMGQQGAIVGDSDTAAQFDGATSGSKVTSTVQELTLPQVFSLEAWVKAGASANGGLIVGYNQSATNDGSTSRHDRVLYMDTNGQLRFGVNPTTAVAIGSTTDYRDDQWHHVVGTLSPAGMKLYVDGALVDQRADITYARTGYTGYVRIGSGALNGFPGTNTSTGRRFEGQIDDVALYRKALPLSRIAAHYTATVNEPPVASFTATQNALSVTFDGSASSDADGTLSSWEWDFGDGSPVSSAPGSTSHVYAAPGTYTVSLTVTDNEGSGSAAFTRLVTVTAAPVNRAPVAQFAATPTGPSVAFDGSGSSDPDGTVNSWAWDFGDGSPVVTTATGSATHVYASPGTYAVSLTVTDDDGATSDPFTDDVVIAPPPNQPPIARFVATPSGLTAAFDAAGSTDSDGTITSWEWDFGDGTPMSTTGTGSTSHAYTVDGTYTVSLVVTDDDGADSVAFSQQVRAAAPAPVDSDGDGVPDAQDSCPSVPGPANLGGCPAPAPVDSDGDGVPDAQDSCPSVPGPANLGGCPAPAPSDSDGDGVPDAQDSCPTVAGTSARTGCPPPAVAVTLKAKSGRSKLYVNVNPNKGSGYWRFQVQRLRSDGSWKPLKTYRTKGSGETRTINLRKGTYKVVVFAKYGYQGSTSGSVTLKR